MIQFLKRNKTMTFFYFLQKKGEMEEVFTPSNSAFSWNIELPRTLRDISNSRGIAVLKSKDLGSWISAILGDLDR